MKIKPILINQKSESFQGMFIRFAERLLNHGRKTITIKQASTKERITTKKDSLKNWYTSCLRMEPIVFRTPTSLALFSERAVLRFIKLIQASSKTNIPMILTSHTIRTGLSSVMPALVIGYKCQLLIGCRNTCGLRAASSL